MKYYRGKYTLKHPEKYVGDANNVIYRSSWERTVMKNFDENPDILQWASEELYVHYRSPADDRIHRYFPDFLIKVRERTGQIVTYMVEVKPHSQTKPPEMTASKRVTKRFIREAVTYEVNKAKWLAAQKYCAEKGWKFTILTENNIFKRNK